jgi:L-lactate dehydrogenase complex protein LldG
MPPLNELSWDREQMIEAFAENLDALTGIFHRVNDRTGVLEKLSEIAASEGLTEVMASTDDVVADLDLRSWGKETGVPVFTAADFEDRESFKERVFEKADAGITGANFAIAESGTLCLVHDKDQARLVSLAPIIHIAIVPSDRLFPTYETVTDQIFAEGENPPPAMSHLLPAPA